MDIEWGKDGLDGKLYVLQARPETVQSRAGRLDAGALPDGPGPAARCWSRAARSARRSAPARCGSSRSTEQMHDFNAGRGPGRRHDRPRLGADHEARRGDRHQPRRAHLPRRDHRPRARHPGRRRHRHGTTRPRGRPARSPSPAPRATPACVYDGMLDFEVETTELDAMPDIPVKIMMNVGTPDQAFAFSRLPHRGRRAGPAGVHHQPPDRHPPQGAARPRRIDSRSRRTCAAEIEELIAAYPGPRDFFVQRVAEGVSMIAAAFAPEPVIVRMSDFKSNEYANLLGGALLRAATRRTR